MRILVVSQYFWPESFIITDIVKTLMLQGHAIEVLTGKPNYPDGKIFDGYVAEGSETECFNEAILVRVSMLYLCSLRHLLRRLSLLSI
jgi:hypothetical protein